MVADVDEPDPAPDQVVIEVDAFSINRGETFLLQAPKPGWRPGKDVAGRVIRAAGNGHGPETGARVVAHGEHSGWAERAAVTLDGVATLPDTVPLDVAAALPLAGLTALRLLRAAGPLASRRVLLTGASGGVGHYLVELAARQRRPGHRGDLFSRARSTAAPARRGRDRARHRLQLRAVRRRDGVNRRRRPHGGTTGSPGGRTGHLVRPSQPHPPGPGLLRLGASRLG